MNVKKEEEILKTELGKDIKLEMKEKYDAERMIFSLRTSKKSFHVNASSKARIS